MHVALIAPAWPLGFASGIVTYVHYLRAGMLSLGHRVTVLAFSVHPSDDMVGIHRIEASWQSKTRRLFARLARFDHDPSAWGSVMIADTINRLNRLDPFDVVEMEESFGWFDDVQRRVSIPVFVKLHGPAFLTQVEQATPSGSLLRRIEKEGTALKRAQFVFAPSTDTIAKTFERYGITHLPKHVIPNPINAVKDMRYVWRAGKCDPKLLLFVGRFERIKGADFLLKAFRLMLNADPQLRLTFIGPHDGMIECDEGPMTLDECIDNWFGAGYKHAIDVRGLMSTLSIQELRVRAVATLVCSRWENQPNTALEAMAQGSPVVAVAVGGIQEVIEDGQTGVLVASGSEAEFAQATLELISDLEHAAAIGSRAREYVERVHAPCTIALRTTDFYTTASRCSSLTA